MENHNYTLVQQMNITFSVDSLIGAKVRKLYC